MECESPAVGIDTAALRNTHCQNNDALPQSVDGNEWKYYSIGAMEEVSEKVQKTSTHCISCVAVNGATVKGHSASPDVDAAALHLEKEMSIQRGDG